MTREEVRSMFVQYYQLIKNCDVDGAELIVEKVFKIIDNKDNRSAELEELLEKANSRIASLQDDVMRKQNQIDDLERLSRRLFNRPRH